MAGNEKADTGDLVLALVPVVEPGTSLALPLPSGEQVIVDDLLADALFGEVIDISDIIPRMLSSPAEAAAPVALSADQAIEVASYAVEVLTLPSHAEALTILYDDDIQASGGGIL